jgi:hypothetical protein
LAALKLKKMSGGLIKKIAYSIFISGILLVNLAWAGGPIKKVSSEKDRKPSSATRCSNGNAMLEFHYTCSNAAGEKVSLVKTKDCKNTVASMIDGKPITGSTEMHMLYQGSYPEGWIKLSPPGDFIQYDDSADIQILFYNRDKKTTYVCQKHAEF